MDPLTIMIATSAMSSLAQLYNSEKARGAEKSRLNELENMFDSIKPPDYELSIDQPPELHAEALQQPKFSDPAAAPKFNMNALTPEMLQVVGTYNPQLSAFVEQQAPEILKQSEDMKRGRDAQNKALHEYLRVGEDGFDPVFQQTVQDAARKAQTEANSRQESIMDDFRQRGMANSGLNLAAQLQGSAQSMDRAAQTNAQAAADAYRNRMAALAAGADLGSQIQAEDKDLQQRNADIINSFNEKMTGRRQSYLDQAAGLQNQAQQLNLANQQRVADANVAAKNQAAQDAQSREDQLLQYLYGIKANDVARSDQLAQWKYGQDVSQRDYENAVKTQQAQWAANNKANQNSIKAQQYNDLIAKYNGKAGISGQVGANNIGATQDRNAAIGGLGQIGMLYGASQMNSQNAMKDAVSRGQQDRERAALSADLEQYKKTGSFMTEDEMNAYKKKISPTNPTTNGLYYERSMR